MNNRRLNRSDGGYTGRDGVLKFIAIQNSVRQTANIMARMVRAFHSCAQRGYPYDKVKHKTGIEKPGGFAKMQSPGCLQLDEILRRVSAGAGAKALAERQVWGANPSKIDQGDK